jgi:hypothetical protein
MHNIIQDYRNLKSNLFFLINKSGFKNNYLASKIGMNPANFSLKKQNGNWTENEIESLLDIISTEEIEDYYLAKILENVDKSETISLEEFLIRNK